MTSTFVQLALVAFLLMIAGRVASGEPTINQRGVAQSSSNELSQFVNSEALAALDGFGANRAFAFNTKRARGKMSAFMPMRGRRQDGGVAELMDGRDEPTSDSPIDFLRSAVALAIQQQQLQQQQRQHSMHNAMPRQFVEQLEQHRMRAPAFLENRARPRTTIDNSQQQLLSPGADGGNLMEAKFRRAFHPMRGKRTNINDAADNDDNSASELDEQTPDVDDVTVA